MMTLNDFVNKYKLKNKATSNIINYQIFCSIGLSYVGICLRDGPFEFYTGIVNIHSPKGSHWVCNINENFFDLIGCVCPKKLSRFIIKRL